MGDPPAQCPFCGTSNPTSGRSPTIMCPVWRCPCGALGVGAPVFDLDEAYDELCDMLAIESPPTAPMEPVGTSGMVFVQRYDNNTLVDRMAPSLEDQGFELRDGPRMQWPRGDGGHWDYGVVWARRRASGPTQ